TSGVINLLRDTGDIVLISKLSGIKVFINGEDKGVLSGRFTTNAGRYEIYAVHPDLPMQRPMHIIELKKGESKEVEFNFRYGGLSVDSDPEGIDVLIGDKKIGKTPLKKDVVEPGIVQLIVQSPDLGVLLRTNIEIIENKTASIEVPGFIHISRLGADGVEYFIDDKKLATGVDSIEARPGVHKVRVRGQEGGEQVKEVVVKSLRTNEVMVDANIVLKKQTGDIYIEAEPFNATVVMNNIETNSRAYFKELVPGDYSIKVLCPRYETTNFTVSLSKGEQITNKIILTPSVGSFTISVEPDDAEFSIYSVDDKKQLTGVVKMRENTVQVGRYEAVVRARGYYSEKKEFVINKGSHTNVEFILKPVTGGITINLISPTEGVNYSLNSFSENAIQFNTNGVAPVRFSSVPIGVYRLKLWRPYYVETNLIKEISEGVTNLVDVELVREVGELSLTIIQTNLSFNAITNARYSLTGPLVECPKGFKAPKNKKVPLGGIIKESLPTGDYKFFMEMDGFTPVNISLTVPTSGVINLLRDTGDIVLISSTPGVECEISGPLNKQDINKFIRRLITDKNPIIFNQVPTGDYKLISKLNHKIIDPVTFEEKEKLWLNESKITVEHNKTTTNILTVPISWIKIETDPENSMLYYGKNIIETAPKLLGPFEVGSLVNIIISNKGYKFQTAKFEIKEPQITNIQKIILYRKNGPLPGDIIWTNSLGMRFVPVEGFTNIWFSVWECRIKDYEKFAYANSSASGIDWRESKFKSTLSINHPVVFVTKEQANAFCDWLTDLEHKNGNLGIKYRFRLPTIQEWQIAAGKTIFPWGDTFPPPPMAGNYGSTYSYSKEVFHTAPVGRYAPNKNGLYDMGGNVREWCLDGKNIACGGSFNTFYFEEMLVNYIYEVKDSKANDVGFRCVLELTRE
ncbi:MAG TPA: SUMF1/EgtB/PvdO family nonheme iron enzyme, partial [Verrucomicrobiota bacterium]|nr:SUMF1/EgtB/PvdO family nonheme iron enzyme [Verrucomicrobiota bacterium]